MSVESTSLGGGLPVRSALLLLVHCLRHLRLEHVLATSQVALVGRLRQESTGAAVLEGAVALTEEPQLL